MKPFLTFSCKELSLVWPINHWFIFYLCKCRPASENVEKDFKEMFDTSTMLNHFTTLQEKHRNYRMNTNSNQQIDKAIAKIDIQ